jgi:hypothetical protein
MDADAHGFFKMKMASREPREIRERILAVTQFGFWRGERPASRRRQATTRPARADARPTGYVSFCVRVFGVFGGCKSGKKSRRQLFQNALGSSLNETGG